MKAIQNERNVQLVLLELRNLTHKKFVSAKKLDATGGVFGC